MTLAERRGFAGLPRCGVRVGDVVRALADRPAPRHRGRPARQLRLGVDARLSRRAADCRECAGAVVGDRGGGWRSASSSCCSSCLRAGAAVSSSAIGRTSRLCTRRSSTTHRRSGRRGDALVLRICLRNVAWSVHFHCYWCYMGDSAVLPDIFLVVTSFSVLVY